MNMIFMDTRRFKDVNIIDAEIYIRSKYDGTLAMLWALEILYRKKTYEQVPRLLKAKVKEIMVDPGCCKYFAFVKPTEDTP